MPETILLIEDNLEMAENITGILKLANYEILVANDGKAGVQLAHQSRPDLILCDIMMPGLDGYTVFHILHKDPETACIPFVFLTAKTDRQDIRHGMNLGADDYMTKPFDGHELLKVVEVRLKKNALLKKTFANNLSDVNDFFNRARELKEFNRLSENRPLRKYHKRDFLFMEGETAYELFFIVSGEVKTFKLNPDGKELVTGIYTNGDFIGYAPLLEDTLYNESAIALHNTDVALISREDFISLIYSSREIARKFIKLLSNNLMEAENRLLNLAYQSVRQRVAGALLKMADHYSLPARKALINISRKDISGIIGTATESLNRTLADFRDEGLVEISADGIRIIDRSRLEKVAR